MTSKDSAVGRSPIDEYVELQSSDVAKEILSLSDVLDRLSTKNRQLSSLSNRYWALSVAISVILLTRLSGGTFQISIYEQKLVDFPHFDFIVVLLMMISFGFALYNGLESIVYSKIIKSICRSNFRTAGEIAAYSYSSSGIIIYTKDILKASGKNDSLNSNLILVGIVSFAIIQAVTMFLPIGLGGYYLYVHWNADQVIDSVKTVVLLSLFVADLLLLFVSVPGASGLYGE